MTYNLQRCSAGGCPTILNSVAVGRLVTPHRANANTRSRSVSNVTSTPPSNIASPHSQPISSTSSTVHDISCQLHPMFFKTLPRRSNGFLIEFRFVLQDQRFG